MSELASGPPPVHDLLLALAGRLDDDLLAWARELLAVGEQNQAVELVTAALAAERVVLPPGLRSEVVAAARAARTDLNVERALPPAGPGDATPHRFDATAAPGDAVVAALRGLPARRLAGCAAHVTWRRTPAGAAPGPVPHAVVLVEADPDRSVEVLAYLLATELDRAGAPASVEVFTAGTALPAYHAAAFRDAREVVRGAVADEPPTRGRHGADEPAAPSGPPAAAAEPGVPAPEDAEPGAATVRRPAAGRRRRPEQADETAQAGSAAAPAAPLPSAPPTADPLSGPLREPLLAPLLDPTGSGGGSDEPVASQPMDRDDPPVDPVTAAEPPGPAGPEVPGPRDVPEEWHDDWRSGEWAMPRTGAPDRDSGFDVFGMPGKDVSETATGLPGQSERTRRIQRGTGSDEDAGAPGPVPRRAELPPAAPGGVSLFESPTARVEQGPPRLSSTREPAAGQPDVAPPDGIRAVPLPDGPPIEPGTPEGSLFGDAPSSASPGGPRQGRRRRPDDEAPAPADPRPAANEPHPDPGSSGLPSGTEHDLLAHLQAEYGSPERRPRPYRRAGQNGATRAVNGHGPGDGDRTPSDG